VITFDYETEGIVGNPIFNPPRPVGVSIKLGDQRSKYWAWGHPTGNNCSQEEGYARLREALKRDPEWLAHNAAFEAAVTKKWLKLKKGNPVNFHDTQYLLFLTDPYAYTFSLKPSAERILGMPPSEQEEVRDWLLAHQPMREHGITLGTGREETETRHFWARYICLAPGDLVGKYAEGDTDRTYELFRKLHPQVLADGMEQAYQREQRLMPVLSESSARGIRLDTGRLSRDLEIYTQAQKAAEDYLKQVLGDFNIDSDRELAAALDRAGQVTEWVLTPTGKRSTSRKNLAGRVRDPKLLSVLGYRGVLGTCLGTFAHPWLAQAGREGGRLHPQWNQVRGNRGSDGDMSGTRTGRMSCREPNFQNVPNDFEGLVIPDFLKDIIPPWLNPVPLLRLYLLPEEGHVWLKRDFNAQEMRVMAHFAEGHLYEAFHNDPATDPHESVRRIIRDLTGLDLPRKYVKITGFGIMYGRGIDSLSLALGVPRDEGKSVRDAYFAALPEVRELSFDTRNIGKRGQCITTWGGRKYYREPNPDRDLSYKLLNYLIQGSAADQTKQSIIDWNEARGEEDLLLAAVHDENNISAPIGRKKEAMHILRETMDAPRFDVPFMSTGFAGPNWSEIGKYE
jgi:DNA polymerase I - 3''-5'' exonuclease and polymerase domains